MRDNYAEEQKAVTEKHRQNKILNKTLFINPETLHARQQGGAF